MIPAHLVIQIQGLSREALVAWPNNTFKIAEEPPKLTSYKKFGDTFLIFYGSFYSFNFSLELKVLDITKQKLHS